MKSRIFSAVVLAALSYGCSLVDTPVPTEASLSLRFVRGEATANAAVDGGKTADALAHALAVSDSIRVNVYPPGTGTTPETSTGLDIAGNDTIQLVMTVVAEQNKRVSVELYEAGRMSFFGVNEDVDVAVGQNTRVSIQALAFQMGTVTVAPGGALWEGDSFTMTWPSIPTSANYRIQLSPVPDFSLIVWESSMTDTFLAGTLPAGNYYFRIAGMNAYTQTSWGAAFIHMGGAPQVTAISPTEVLRNDVVDFDVWGVDLDHPSTQVRVFGQLCTILSSAPEYLQVRVGVPARAFSDLVTATNQFGSGASSQLMKVYTIAYIMGPSGSGDIATANAYKALIESYGGEVQESAVFILPYNIMGSVDLTVFDLIVVGHDTGTDTNDWGGGLIIGQIRADQITNAGAAILGLGRGGSAYFELAGLNIGIKSCVMGNSNNVWVADPAADIFSTPNRIQVPGNRILNVYTAGPIRLGVQNPPNGVNRYASWNSVSSNFTIADEPVAGPDNLNNFLWGFEGAPSDLTATYGTPLFENVVKFMFDDGTKDVLPLTSP
jgi:hypothetical protein